jgi:hypothetical protein
MSDSKLMVLPMRSFEHQPDSHAPCKWDDPDLATLYVCVDRTGEAKVGQGGSYGTIVATMNEDRLGYVCEEFAQEQWEKTLAMARLFAAAPDLLAALEQTLATLDAVCEMQGFDKHKQHGSEAAREAIALAAPPAPSEK